MARTKLSEYSTTNSDNTDIENINIAEGCAPSGINNAIRELMVHLKEFQTGSSGDPLTVAGTFVASGGATIAASAGTSASPSIHFSGDTNTGIFSPAADTIAFTEGGAESMRIDSSGRIGVGTNSPVAIVDASYGDYQNAGALRIGADIGVFTSRTNNTRKFGAITTPHYDNSEANLVSIAMDSQSNSVSVLNIGGGSSSFNGPSSIAFYTSAAGITDGTERMRIDSSGNVGIGTTSLTGKFTVRQSSDATNGGIVIEDTSGGGAVISRLTDGGLTFRNGGLERARITSGGELLVNIATNPFSTWKMTVDGGSNDSVASITNVVNGYPFISWNKATSGDNYFVGFFTEGTITQRGSIDYNRGAALTRYNTTSDATLKNIIGNSDGQKSLEILNSTRIREYAWKDDPAQKPQIGVIAQELYETFKGAVSVGGDLEQTDEEGNVTTKYSPWGVDKTAFTFHLVAGWQAHEKKIAEQQAKIDALETRLAALEAK
jgi:hypothetical protein